MISAFSHCSSLVRIEIPAFVEIITDYGFNDCSFKEVIFPANGRLRILGGFEGSVSLCRVEIPGSGESIKGSSFARSYSLHEVVFAPGSHIRRFKGLTHCESLSRIEIQDGFPIPDLPFFEKMESCLVVLTASNEWSMLFEVCDDSYVIDEPLFDFSEIPESVNVEDGIVKISKISDRLLCFCALWSIEIPSFIGGNESYDPPVISSKE
jgi:hypothetical protein